MNSKTQNSIRQAVLCALFAALIAVGAWIRIPVGTVPFTMQVFFVLFSGMLLGWRGGAVSVLLYIAVGLLGFPIFSKGGGIWYIFNPQFGYLIGFLFASALVGYLCGRKGVGFWRRTLAGLLGIAVIYLLGVIYYALICRFYLGEPKSLPFLLWYCFLVTLPGDIVSCLICASLAGRIRRAIYPDERREYLQKSEQDASGQKEQDKKDLF